jgi:hypothetical protein
MTLQRRGTSRWLNPRLLTGVEQRGKLHPKIELIQLSLHLLVPNGCIVTRSNYAEVNWTKLRLCKSGTYAFLQCAPQTNTPAQCVEPYKANLCLLLWIFDPSVDLLNMVLVEVSQGTNALTSTSAQRHHRA